MKATFLGTGTSQGIPVIACDCPVCNSPNPKDNRTRTSLLISIDGKNLVIDTGPDFRQQMLREKVKSLDAVFFTHEHKDHISGLDDIRAYNYITQLPMEVFATEKVFAALQREFHYVFDGTNYPGIPQVNMNFFDQEPIHFAGEEIIPIEVMHYKLPVKAFRIRNFSYITDANYIDEQNMKKLAGTEILVINALRREHHISHFTLDEALEIIARIKPRKAYLIHISHLLGLHDVVSAELPENVEIAYDGLQINIS
ncbi:MAG: MBL fold metallo-hydrolase [Bacteroidetes bacterium]|nr:MBL fold metallo-hydrolase [Bacteroidota bacterium]